MELSFQNSVVNKALMMSLYLLFIIALIANGSIAARPCPCSDASLCKNVQTNYSKELYGFIGGGNSQRNDSTQYNWTYVTALANKDEYTNGTGMDQVMCTAHSHNVRMIYQNKASLPFTDNITIQMEWIQHLFDTVTELFYDGVTFDYEGSMLWTDPQSKQYTTLVNLTTQYFHKHLPGSTISVCVPFEAYLQWGREYDYYGLAQASDYLYIMGYDTNGQIWDGQCIARAVSPIMNIQRGVQSYLNLQIDPSKLILGVPWYGKYNVCIYDELENGLQSKYCPLIPKDNKGVNCSNGNNDKSGTSEISYATIMHNVYTQPINVSEIRWDDTQKSSYYNYVGKHEDKNTTLNQVWYDDVQSLIYKYSYAKSMNLRGLGPFQFGDLIEDKNDPTEKERAQQMWAAFDTFFA